MSRYEEAHRNRTGPGDARPTALQIVQDEEKVGALKGKVALVTGCSKGGIGLETARALHATGCDLYLTLRDPASQGASLVQDIKSSGLGQGKIEILPLQLDSLAAVRRCAEEFLQKSQQLNILILNAGVMATPQSKTEDGFETQLGTNFYGHFLLFQLLKPALLQSTTPAFQSRVVSLSSAAHRMSGINFDDLNLTKDYDPFKAYGQSNTAKLYLANEIERRYGKDGLHATAVHPGGILTNVSRHLPEETLQYIMANAPGDWFQSLEQGAATTVWAAVGAEWEGRGGAYLEDCHEGKPYDENDTVWGAPGYGPHAYDQAAAERLYDITLKLLGIEE